MKKTRAAPTLSERTLDKLSIRDERSLAHVALYADLKEVLLRDKYIFRILPGGRTPRWDRALFLNLTYWDAAGGDILDTPRIHADVVAHAAWHHLAARVLATPAETAEAAEPGRMSAEALILGESIASAFDVYLVGRLLGHAPRSSFLQSQVLAMAASAKAAGLSEKRFEALLEEIAEHPERSFLDLRALLWDATVRLAACQGAGEAHEVLDDLHERPFAPLLHHYELSNWVLYARAHASEPSEPDSVARRADRILRLAPDPMAWLRAIWIAPALGEPKSKWARL